MIRTSIIILLLTSIGQALAQPDIPSMEGIKKIEDRVYFADTAADGSLVKTSIKKGVAYGLETNFDWRLTGDDTIICRVLNDPETNEEWYTDTMLLDRKGNVKDSRAIYPGGGQFWHKKWEYFYDLKGQPNHIDEFIEKDGKMVKESGTQLVYGTQGLKTAFEFNRRGEMKRKYSYQYENGRLSERKCIIPDAAPGSEIDPRCTLKYNEQGDIVQGYDGVTYSYTYDDRKNWVRKACQHPSAPAEIVIRTIEYGN